MSKLWFTLIITLLLTACGGNSSSNDTADDDGTPSNTSSTDSTTTNTGTNTDTSSGSNLDNSTSQNTESTDSSSGGDSSNNSSDNNSTSGNNSSSNTSSGSNTSTNTNTGNNIISDADNDSIADSNDNCPNTPNSDQLNTDNDAQGNACDTDDDNDGMSDADEIAQNTSTIKSDTDGDGVNDKDDELPLDNTKAATPESAYRLLTQASFGATSDEIDNIVQTGTNAWIETQLAKTSAYDSSSDTHKTHLERTIEIAQAAEPTTTWYSNPAIFNSEASFTADEYQMAAWWENAIGLHPTNTAHGSDQLRQRIAFALSQLLVASSSEPPLHRRGESLAFYYDILARNALGNYRTLLGEVARSPTMGIFLSHQGNRKADPTAGTRPDENFAREIMQLFTISLYQLNIDGSPDRDSNPNTYPDSGTALTPTYDQTDIEELAKVMTGWDLRGNTDYGKNGNTQGDYTQFMEFTASEHEDEQAAGGDGKVTLLGTTIDLNSGNDNSGMDAALDVLFNHQNVGPYVSKHLIMRLVTSNPSADYVARVTQVFNDNGQSVRGDLKAVAKAILTDEEARSDTYKTQANFGKAKEPLIAWTQLLRAFKAVPLDGWISKDNTPVNGVYWYKAPEKDMKQGAMRSPSVFNFYMPDFVPSSTHFANNQLVSPEMQIQTDQILLEFSNQVYTLVTNFEQNKITNIDGLTLANFATTRKHSNAMILVINFDKEYEVFEQALDGDNNGDFSNMEATDTDNIRFRDKAIDALLIHLDTLLLGGTMTDEYRQAMKDYLTQAAGIRHGDDVKEARNIIRNAVRMIATSSAYMIQK